MFRAVILGSGASLPTLQRRSASVAVQYEGDLHLFDCGEGTQLQWRRAALRFGRLRGIHISHLHGDHINGLVGLMQTLSLGGRELPLQVSGPVGIAGFLDAIRCSQGVRFGYAVEVRESSGGVLVEGTGYRIECAVLDHGIATLGFAFVEDDRPGRFNVDRAVELGLPPGPEYRRLQNGENVTTADGTEIRPAQVLGSPRAGRRLAYCVDTRPCVQVVALAKDAALLICDSTFGADLEKEAWARRHCTAAQAAQMASDAGCERLLLSHISARYHDARPLLAQARAVFPRSALAADLMEIAV